MRKEPGDADASEGENKKRKKVSGVTGGPSR